VQSYAIDNPSISFSCARNIDGSVDLHTAHAQSSIDTVRLIYGAALGKELTSLNGEQVVHRM
jgi:DNA mismatch repair ATPase MutL